MILTKDRQSNTYNLNVTKSLEVLLQLFDFNIMCPEVDTPKIISAFNRHGHLKAITGGSMSFFLNRTR